jgi:hypothetical protein
MIVITGCDVVTVQSQAEQASPTVNQVEQPKACVGRQDHWMVTCPACQVVLCPTASTCGSSKSRVRMPYKSTLVEEIRKEISLLNPSRDRSIHSAELRSGNSGVLYRREFCHCPNLFFRNCLGELLLPETRLASHASADGFAAAQEGK